MNDLYTSAAMARKKLVDDFGGATKLAPLVRMNPGTLSNKVNLNLDSHHVTAEENVAMMAVSKDYGPIMADAATLGGVFTLLPSDLASFNDEELLSLYLEWVKETGETASTIKNAMADGKIDARELQDITRECFEDMTRQLELLQAITKRAEQHETKRLIK